MAPLVVYMVGLDFGPGSEVEDLGQPVQHLAHR